MSRCQVEVTDTGMRFIVRPPLLLLLLGLAGYSLLVGVAVKPLLATELSFEHRLAHGILLLLGLPIAFFAFQVPLLITSEIVEVDRENLRIRREFLGIGYTWQYRLALVHHLGYSPVSYKLYSHTITFEYIPDLGQTHTLGQHFDVATAQHVLAAIERYQQNQTVLQEQSGIAPVASTMPLLNFHIPTVARPS